MTMVPMQGVFADCGEYLIYYSPYGRLKIFPHVNGHDWQSEREFMDAVEAAYDSGLRVCGEDGHETEWRFSADAVERARKDWQGGWAAV